MTEKSWNPYVGERAVRRPGSFKFPVVSVIVVVFQDRTELNRLIDELVPFRVDGKLEVVVIDGGSNDGSLELLHERTEDVDFWLSENDAGIFDAMNKGISAARGKYIIHIMAGDSLLAVPWHHLLVEGNGPAWVSCQVREDWGIFQPRLSWVTRFANTNHNQGSFLRRDLHLGYKSDYRVYADFEHHLRLLRRGIKPTLVYELVAEHRGGGASSDSRWIPEEARAVQENYGWFFSLVPKFMAPVRRYREKLLGPFGFKAKTNRVV